MRRAIFAVALLFACGALPASAASTSLAPLGASTDWLNGRGTPASLRGKVVLVDVFTVDCGNCENVTANLRMLNTQDRGRVAIVGVHTPETPYERQRPHVVDRLKALGVTWPVAVDDDQTLWATYGIEAWPTQLIFDRAGHLRKTIVGDGQDAAVDAEIHALLAEK